MVPLRQFGLYHVDAPLSFLFSVSPPSLFAILSIFGSSNLLQILGIKQAAFLFAVLYVIVFHFIKWPQND